ncbi:hypothetical protein LPJ53_003430 [Coemansia erecta]|uniref:2-dehydropantoate 2-reductase n=1 Tax=Coemansia erecta TaxID=147472 RepID=A0A9W7Y0R2_9FUNG|nr:hypothetical protein LPJ53_003430 [Coemansia erecta]
MSSDSDSSSPIKVLVVGTGALGSVYAWRLQTSGQTEITAVCRSNYDVVSTKGFEIQSKLFGTHTFKPSKVVRTVDEATETYDYILICTKALPNLSDNSSIITSAVRSPTTAIVLIQNGIGIEDPFVARFPDNPVISVVAYIDASQPANGLIEHGTNVGLVMGAHPLSARLAQIWNATGVKCLVSDKIQAFRWLKLVWNASFNTISVVSGGNDTRKMLEDPGCRKLIRDTMGEVYRLGEAAVGEKLPAFMGIEGPDMYLAYTEREDSTVWPSMLMDFKAGRPMEHAVILGRPLEIARELGVDVPRLEAIHALLVMVEKQRQG